MGVHQISEMEVLHRLEENMEVEADHALVKLEMAEMELFISNLVSD